MSTEGNGNVYRFDHLPTGQHAAAMAKLVPRREFAPIPAIRRMLSAHGTTTPAMGKGAIAYVIAAYHNFETVSIDGVKRQLFGFEWAYTGGCPATRKCGPTSFGVATFDAAACFAARTDHRPSPNFSLHCLSGPDMTPSGTSGVPIRFGQAFGSIRTITTSPFGDGDLSYGGYDCNPFPADGTAWIARSPRSTVHLDHPTEANP